MKTYQIKEFKKEKKGKLSLLCIIHEVQFMLKETYW